ncbi:hypothetical protein [Flagellimonas sp.]|uniref:hypothetical protein n=1 Tax=Flagellimonas sp. TaxID=2058762 RepID=UPI003F4A7CFC
MKKLLTLTLLLGSITSFFAQEFKYDKNGLTDYVTKEVSGLSSKEIYAKAKLWITSSYANPEQVLRLDEANYKIRIASIKKKGFCVESQCSDYQYEIEITFDEGTYKFDPLRLAAWAPEGAANLPLEDGSIYFKKNGKPKSYSKKIIGSIEKLFNDLDASLYKYVSKEKLEEGK